MELVINIKEQSRVDEFIEMLKSLEYVSIVSKRTGAKTRNDTEHLLAGKTNKEKLELSEKQIQNGEVVRFQFSEMNDENDFFRKIKSQARNITK